MDNKPELSDQECIEICRRVNADDVVQVWLRGRATVRHLAWNMAECYVTATCNKNGQPLLYAANQRIIRCESFEQVRNELFDLYKVFYD